MLHGHIVARRVVTTLLLALAFGVRAASAGSISIQWDPNTEPDVMGYRVYIGTQSGVYTSSVDVGIATTYVYNEGVAGQKYCFAVAAYTAGPRVGEQSVEVCSDSSGNKPPTLTSPGNQSHSVGTALTLTLNGSDPEGNPVTYSASGLPPGVTLNSNTGFIAGTPTTVGTFNTHATVSDGSLSLTHAFTWTITAANAGAATPLRPSGTLSTSTPTFEWESVVTATSYRLWVDDSSNVDPKIQLDLTPSQAGCTTAGAVCRVSPGVVLQAGRGSWSVRASNTSGPGPWSGAMDFTVPDVRVPTVTIATPTAAASYTTSATTVALGGTATDDAGVSSVTWTNNLGGSGTASGTSTWTVGSVPIKVGTNVITVTARDSGGNIATDVLTVTKSDSQSPSLSIASPGSTSSTTSAAVPVNGTSNDDGAVTQVTWVNDRGGNGTAAGTHTWSIAAVGLKPGANVITVTAHDGAGNKTAKSLTVSLTDGEAPAVAIAAPVATSTFSTTNSTIALGGTASDNTGVVQVTWSNNQGGNGAAAGTAAWTVAGVALKPGQNVITVTAKDAAGNTATDVLTVTVADAVAPEVSITTPTSGDTHRTTSASVTLGGTASDAGGVKEVRWINDRGGAGVASGTTAWSVAALALQPGVNVITVTASDAAGNVSRDRVTISVDSLPPTVSIATPAAATVTKNETVDLAGKASDDRGVTEVTWTSNRGGSGRAIGTNSWSIANAPLQGGVNVFTVVAEDGGGNRTSATVSVTRDSQLPAVRIVAPTDDETFATSKATVALSGKTKDDAGVTQVTWKNSRGGSGTATGTNEWAVPSVALLAGANVITVTARDAAGNLATDTLTVTLDARAPVVSFAVPTSASTFATNESRIAIGGVAKDDVAIADVTWSNSQGGSGGASGESAWSARVALKPGLNVLTVTARDTVGNVGSATLAVRATDISAPAVRIMEPSAEKSFSTVVGVINLAGAANDDFAVERITWASDRGASGVARRDTATRWSVGSLSLQPGVNVIKVTASDASGNTSTDAVRVTYEQGLPAISLTSPTTAETYSTSSSNVALTGVASNQGGISRVKWSTDKGQAGDAVGTTSWSIPTLTVGLGTTNVTVTAYDNSGNASSVRLSVVHTDTIKPTVKLYMPTTASSMTTTSPSLTLGGTATDNIGVTEVRWATDRGASGTAFGTTGWSTPSVPLLPGATTVITITARDAAGNTASAVISVTSTASPASFSSPTSATSSVSGS